MTEKELIRKKGFNRETMRTRFRGTGASLIVEPNQFNRITQTLNFLLEERQRTNQTLNFLLEERERTNQTLNFLLKENKSKDYEIKNQTRINFDLKRQLDIMHEYLMEKITGIKRRVRGDDNYDAHFIGKDMEQHAELMSNMDEKYFKKFCIGCEKKMEVIDDEKLREFKIDEFRRQNGTRLKELIKRTREKGEDEFMLILCDIWEADGTVEEKIKRSNDIKETKYNDYGDEEKYEQIVQKRVNEFLIKTDESELCSICFARKYQVENAYK